MKTYGGIYRKALCLLLSTAIFLTGCGSSDAVSGQSTPEPSRQTIDWNSHQVVANPDTATGTQWHLREYYEDWIAIPEKYSWKYSEYSESPAGDFCAKTQYALYNDDGSFSRAWYCLDYFDIETRNSFHVEVDPEEWGVPKSASLDWVDVADDKLAACYFCSSMQEDAPISYCSLILYHMENGVQRTLDLLPALTAAGLADSTVPLSEQNVLCDLDGYCYIVLEDKILIVDESGQFLLLAPPEEGAVPLTYLCKTPEGLPIFVGMDSRSRSTSFWSYDRNAGTLRCLGKTDYIALRCGCADSYGDVYYYTSMGKMVRWNTLSGLREDIFDCDANDICLNHSAGKRMAIRADGDLVIMDPMTETRSIYVLSPNPPGEERILTLISTREEYASRMEQTAAALFSQKNPGVRIEFSALPDGEDREVYITNLINRIVSGDGPDMLIVPPQAMHTLYEKGALADISDAIPTKLREQVFTSVWNAGTVDGKLIGLTTSLSCRSMLVSDDVWPQDTWTLEDMLEIAENAPGNSLKGLIPMPDYAPIPSYLLYELALRDISSSLVDRETGTCYFDSEMFRKLLEYCGNTPIPETDGHYPNPAPARSVAEGEYLAYSCGVGSLFDFSDQMSFFPEGYHWVGVPTSRGNGNLAYASDFLVVNSHSENMDLILEFLPTLYGEEMARRYPYSCLRRDVLRNRVVIPDWDPRPQFNMGEGVYTPLTARPDGNSYVEEYIAFMDSCVLFPAEDELISSIVLEETAAYFSGDKDLDAVIDIIQNRIQIYLDENKS